MKRRHGAKLPQPIQQNGNITVTDEDLRMMAQLLIQIRQQLNRTEPAARAEDGVNVFSAEKVSAIIASTPAISDVASTAPAGASTPIQAPGFRAVGLFTGTGPFV
jgi:hypothetical protein